MFLNKHPVPVFGLVIWQLYEFPNLLWIDEMFFFYTLLLSIIFSDLTFWFKAFFLVANLAHELWENDYVLHNEYFEQGQICRTMYQNKIQGAQLFLFYSILKTNVTPRCFARQTGLTHIEYQLSLYLD